MHDARLPVRALNRKAVAEFLGVSPSRVNALTDQGMPFEDRNGRRWYDGAECLAWCAGNVRTRARNAVRRSSTATPTDCQAPAAMPGRILWLGRNVIEHEDGADTWAEAVVDLPASCKGFDCTGAAERWARELAAVSRCELAVAVVKGRGVEAEYVRGLVAVSDAPQLCAQLEARAACVQPESADRAAAAQPEPAAQ